MLNYNKSFRESNGKNNRKSIYSGSKLHTTSMNLRASYQINECPIVLIRDIENREKNKNIKPSVKKMRSSIKLQQKPKKTQIIKSKQSQQLPLRISHTERLNEQNIINGKNIQIYQIKDERRKTDMNQDMREAMKCVGAETTVRSQKQEYVEIEINKLKKVMEMIKRLKKQKDSLAIELNFIKKNYKKQNVFNSAIRALNC